MGNLLLGRNIADSINQTTINDIAKMKSINHVHPTLTLITADGSNPLKISEVLLHENLAKQLGINVKNIILEETIQENELREIIEQNNNDKNVQGILVLLPLPEHMDQERVLSYISPAKELEGLNEIKTLSNLFQGKQISTISSMFIMLNSVGYDMLSGKNILLIEDWILESNPVVRRLLELAETLNLNIELIKTSNPNIKEIASQADLLLLSLEEPESVDKHYIKENAIVIDFNPIVVGEAYSEEKGRIVPVLKTCLNVESALTKAKHVAPSLGGIGPIALANLMRNFVHNCNLAINSNC